MSSIEAVIWDMGGIIYVTPFEVLDDYERRKGWPAGTLPRGPFGPEGDAEYAKCSTGELSENDYWADYHRAAADAGYPIDLKHDVDWIDRLRPEVMKTIETLSPDFIQGTLSNDSSKWLGQGWWETWPYAHHFAAIVDVEMLGIRKPHPMAYLAAAERLDVPADRCLFVDDMQVNIDGAEQVGMPAFFFDHTDAAGSCERLLAHLGVG